MRCYTKIKEYYKNKESGAGIGKLSELEDELKEMCEGVLYRTYTQEYYEIYESFAKKITSLATQEGGVYRFLRGRGLKLALQSGNLTDFMLAVAQGESLFTKYEDERTVLHELFCDRTFDQSRDIIRKKLAMLEVIIQTFTFEEKLLLLDDVDVNGKSAAKVFIQKAIATEDGIDSLKFKKVLPLFLYSMHNGLKIPLPSVALPKHVNMRIFLGAVIYPIHYFLGISRFALLKLATTTAVKSVVSLAKHAVDIGVTGGLGSIPQRVIGFAGNLFKKRQDSQPDTTDPHLIAKEGIAHWFAGWLSYFRYKDERLLAEKKEQRERQRAELDRLYEQEPRLRRAMEEAKAALKEAKVNHERKGTAETQRELGTAKSHLQRAEEAYEKLQDDLDEARMDLLGVMLVGGGLRFEGRWRIVSSVQQAESAKQVRKKLFWALGHLPDGVYTPDDVRVFFNSPAESAESHEMEERAQRVYYLRKKMAVLNLSQYRFLKAELAECKYQFDTETRDILCHLGALEGMHEAIREGTEQVDRDLCQKLRTLFATVNHDTLIPIFCRDSRESRDLWEKLKSLHREIKEKPCAFDLQTIYLIGLFHNRVQRARTRGLSQMQTYKPELTKPGARSAKVVCEVCDIAHDIDRASERLGKILKPKGVEEDSDLRQEIADLSTLVNSLSYGRKLSIPFFTRLKKAAKRLLPTKAEHFFRRGFNHIIARYMPSHQAKLAAKLFHEQYLQFALSGTSNVMLGYGYRSVQFIHHHLDEYIRDQFQMTAQYIASCLARWGITVDLFPLEAKVMISDLNGNIHAQHLHSLEISFSTLEKLRDRDEELFMMLLSEEGVAMMRYMPLGGAVQIDEAQAILCGIKEDHPEVFSKLIKELIAKQGQTAIEELIYKGVITADQSEETLQRMRDGDKDALSALCTTKGLAVINDMRKIKTTKEIQPESTKIGKGKEESPLLTGAILADQRVQRIFEKIAEYSSRKKRIFMKEQSIQECFKAGVLLKDLDVLYDRVDRKVFELFTSRHAIRFYQSYPKGQGEGAFAELLKKYMYKFEGKLEKLEIYLGKKRTTKRKRQNTFLHEYVLSISKLDREIQRLETELARRIPTIQARAGEVGQGIVSERTLEERRVAKLKRLRNLKNERSLARDAIKKILESDQGTELLYAKGSYEKYVDGELINLDGCNVLHLAVALGNLDLVELFIKADRQRNRSGRSRSIFEKRTDAGDTALLLAESCDDLMTKDNVYDKILALLIAPYQSSLAVSDNPLQAWRRGLEANINAQNKKGQTVLQLAMNKRDWNTVLALLTFDNRCVRAQLRRAPGVDSTLKRDIVKRFLRSQGKPEILERFNAQHQDSESQEVKAMEWAKRRVLDLSLESDVRSQDGEIIGRKSLAGSLIDFVMQNGKSLDSGDINSMLRKKERSQRLTTQELATLQELEVMGCIRQTLNQRKQYTFPIGKEYQVLHKALDRLDTLHKSSLTRQTQPKQKTSFLDHILTGFGLFEPIMGSAGELPVEDGVAPRRRRERTRTMVVGSGAVATRAHG